MFCWCEWGISSPYDCDLFTLIPLTVTHVHFSLNRVYCLQKQTVQALTDSDYSAHSVPLLLKFTILDIYQAVSNSYIQIHGCRTGTANSFHCWTNLKKVHNSLPRSKDLEFPFCWNHFFVGFSQLDEKKAARDFSKIIRAGKAQKCSTIDVAILLCTRWSQL